LPTCSRTRCTKWISSSIPNWLACTSTTGWPTRPTSKSRTCCPREKSRTRRDLCWWAYNRIIIHSGFLLCRTSRSQISQNLDAIEILKYHYDKTQYFFCFPIEFRQNESLLYKSLLYFMISDNTKPIENNLKITRINIYQYVLMFHVFFHRRTPRISRDFGARGFPRRARKMRCFTLHLPKTRMSRWCGNPEFSIYVSIYYTIQKIILNVTYVFISYILLVDGIPMTRLVGSNLTDKYFSRQLK